MSLMGQLPVVLVVLTLLTFVASYIIAVARGDVSAAFPYISDTGSVRPESCIFGQFLNIASGLALSTMFFYNKAIETIVGDINEDPWIRRLNRSSMVVGIISCLGVSIVANFQEGTIVENVHYVGAIMAFAFGTIYCFLVAALSYQMYPCFNGIYTCRIRLAIAVVSVIAMVISIISGGVAFHEWNKIHHSMREELRWTSKDPGYSAHVVSSTFEWVTALTFFVFFLTYVKELNKFTLEIKARPAVHYFGEDESIHSTKEPNERSRLIL